MVLVYALLEGNDFKSWYRAIKIALGVKKKLNFIEGIIFVPDRGSK